MPFQSPTSQPADGAHGEDRIRAGPQPVTQAAGPSTSIVSFRQDRNRVSGARPPSAQWLKQSVFEALVEAV